MEMFFENSENRELNINSEDIPFICRICLKRGELRLFEDEDYLLDLFLTITKIDDGSAVNIPRNICDECINKLEDISLFIDIPKCNNARQEKILIPKKENEYKAVGDCGISQEREIKTEKITEEYEEYIYSDGTEICQTCSLTSSQTPFGEKVHLMQVFQNITNIEVKAESNFLRKHGICSKCTDELKKIKSFISLSLCNNMKLKNTIGGDKVVKTEDCCEENGIDIVSPKYNITKFQSFPNRNEVKMEVPVCLSNKMSQEARRKKCKRALNFFDDIPLKRARNMMAKSLAKLIVTDNSEDEFEPREKVFKRERKSSSMKRSDSKHKVANYSNAGAWPSDKKRASSTVAVPNVLTVPPIVAPIKVVGTSIKAILPLPEAAPPMPKEVATPGSPVPVTRHVTNVSIPHHLREVSTVVREVFVEYAEKKRSLAASDSAILKIDVESADLEHRLSSLAKRRMQEVILRAKRQAELDVADAEVTEFRDEMMKLFEIHLLDSR